MSMRLASIRLVSVPLTLWAMLCGLPVQAQESPDNADQSLAPYFLIPDGDPAIDQLPLTATSADVNIAGVIADVTVTQIYNNSGTRPIEAVYVFPASTRAAVHGLTMTIGERVIEAVVQEKEEARATYEQAKTEGRSASLLEQERPNVFRMNVANILPNDEIKVELHYTELLVPDAGVYEFVYPTVVGPRYSSPDNPSGDESFNANPYQHAGEAPLYDFGLDITLRAGMPVAHIDVPTHKTTTTRPSPDTAHITLDDSEIAGGNRDFILRYRLAGENIQSGLLLFEGEGDAENYFLLISQPPSRVRPDHVPAREYLFVVDVSGSMGGFPLETSKALLRDLFEVLEPQDSFNILFFAGGSQVLSPTPLAATANNLRKAEHMLTELMAGGGTELLPALHRALAMPTVEGTSRSIVIITDGYVTVEKQAFDLIRENLNRANVFTFGIGSGVNRFLIEGLARAGQGEPFVVTDPSEAEKNATRLKRYIQSPVLTNTHVIFEGFDAYDIEPKSTPDILAERPVLIYGKWRGPRTGQIRVSGLSGTGDFERVFEVAEVAPSDTNAALQYLWARERIKLLGDYQSVGEDTEAEITALGLEHNLLTNYTSFVAVDTLVRNETGESTTVRQPLPLPQGVENSAVGRGFMARTMALSAPAPAPMPMLKHHAGPPGATGASGPVGPSGATGAPSPISPPPPRENAEEETPSLVEGFTLSNGIHITTRTSNQALTSDLDFDWSTLSADLAVCMGQEAITLRLTVDANGTAGNIVLLSPTSQVTQCLIQLIAQHRFNTQGEFTVNIAPYPPAN